VGVHPDTGELLKLGVRVSATKIRTLLRRPASARRPTNRAGPATGGVSTFSRRAYRNRSSHRCGSVPPGEALSAPHPPLGVQVRKGRIRVEAV
jgi:hypothetical protein